METKNYKVTKYGRSFASQSTGQFGGLLVALSSGALFYVQATKNIWEYTYYVAAFLLVIGIVYSISSFLFMQRVKKVSSGPMYKVNAKCTIDSSDKKMRYFKFSYDIDGENHSCVISIERRREASKRYMYVDEEEVFVPVADLDICFAGAACSVHEVK